MTFDEECYGLHTGLVARQEILCLHRKAVTFCPASIHPEEHLRPILSLRAPGTRMKLQIGIVRIVGAGKKNLQLQRLQSLLDGCDLSAHILLHRRILILHAHLPESLSIFLLCQESLVLVHTDFKVTQLLIDFLRLFRIIPEGRLPHLILQFSYLVLLVSDVKVNPPSRSASP